MSTAGASARRQARTIRARRSTYISASLGMLGAAALLVGSAVGFAPFDALETWQETACELGALLAVAASGFSWQTARKKYPVSAAIRWEMGAEGEEATGRLLEEMRGEGWFFHHDRKILGTHANIDHAAISPCGSKVVVINSKRWAKDRAVTRNPEGRLYSWRTEDGSWSNRLQDKDVWGLMHEADKVTRALGRATHLERVMVVHGARVVDPGTGAERPISLERSSTRLGRAVLVHVVPAGSLADFLRQMQDGPSSYRAARALSERVERSFPPYTE